MCRYWFILCSLWNFIIYHHNLLSLNLINSYQNLSFIENLCECQSCLQAFKLTTISLELNIMLPQKKSRKIFSKRSSHITLTNQYFPAFFEYNHSRTQPSLQMLLKISLACWSRPGEYSAILKHVRNMTTFWKVRRCL